MGMSVCGDRVHTLTRACMPCPVHNLSCVVLFLRVSCLAVLDLIRNRVISGCKALPAPPSRPSRAEVGFSGTGRTVASSDTGGDYSCYALLPALLHSEDVKGPASKHAPECTSRLTVPCARCCRSRACLYRRPPSANAVARPLMTTARLTTLARVVRCGCVLPCAVGSTRVPNGNPGGTARGDGLGGLGSPSASCLGVLTCVCARARVSEWRSSRPARSWRSSEARCVQPRDEVGSRMLGKMRAKQRALRACERERGPGHSPLTHLLACHSFIPLAVCRMPCRFRSSVRSAWRDVGQCALDQICFPQGSGTSPWASFCLEVGRPPLSILRDV